MLSMEYIFVLPSHDILDVDEEIPQLQIVIIKALFIVNIIQTLEEDESSALIVLGHFFLFKIILAMSLDLLPILIRIESMTCTTE